MRTPQSLTSVAPGALLLCLLCATTDAARAQDPEKTNQPVTPTTPGDENNLAPGPVSTGLGRYLVGDPAPDVNLKDQDGRTFHLMVERRAKPWLLVFVRRPQETADIDAAATGLNALGLGAVILAPFGRDRQRDWVAAPKMPLLTDRASVTARTFGMYDPITSNPRPGAFLIDRRGRITWMISGGLPSAPELVRMTREALEAKGELPAAAGAGKAD
jgi:peroxiredoxin